MEHGWGWFGRGAVVAAARLARALARRGAVVALAALLLAAGRGLAGPASRPSPLTLTWAAGAVGGGWYQQAGGLAEVLQRRLPWLQVRVVPGGGVQNVLAVASGQVELAWGLPPIVDAAIKGQEPYDRPVQGVRAILAGLGVNTFHVAVAADSPLRSFDDIFRSGRNLRITTPVVGSSDEWVFRKILAYYGTSYDELQRTRGFRFFPVSYQEQATLFKDRNVDVFFTQLAVPASAIQEAALGRRMRLLSFPEGLREHLRGFALGVGTIPPGVYQNVENTAPVVTMTMGNVILVHESVPADAVYEITRVLNETALQEVKAVQVQFQTYDPASGWRDTGAPLHAGAERWYREAGHLR